LTAATTTAWPVGAEVTLTVTGRIIHSYGTGVVVEHLNGQGMPTRIAADTTSPSVVVAAAPGPTAAVRDARDRAARMVADACRDTDPLVPVLR
jgi:hypothetical protein